MFEQWKSRYEKMIYHLLHHYQIRYDFEEFHQLTLIKLWQLEQSYQEGRTQNKDQYVYLKLKYFIIDELRKKINYQQRCSLPGDDQLIPLIDEQHPYFHLYIGGLDQLLTEQEQFWLNHALYGFSITEIAERAGKSPSTIKLWRKKAREKISVNLNLTFKYDN